MVGRPIDTAYAAIHSSLFARAQAAVKKFNTPNWDNSRELLVHYTGYDPYSDWSWSRGQLNALASKAFLNEILQVRHSFAHGFLLPSTISWLTQAGSSYCLTAQAIDRVERFLKYLVNAADKGLALHLAGTFGVNVSW